MSFYTSPGFWGFIGGVGATLVGSFLSKQPKTREFAVKTLAKGMEIQQCAQENVQSVRDDAADMAEEARRNAKIEAEKLDRMAAIEARIREQVIAEFEAEEAARAEAAVKAEAEAVEEAVTAEAPKPKRASRKASK